MYKWIYFTDNDIISQLDSLRKKYNTPNKTYYFKEGKYKDRSCIFVLNDLTTRVYKDPVPSNQFKGDLFFAPLDEVSLSNFEVHKDQRDWKIKVNLKANETLWLIPATMEPKKIVFDFNDTAGVSEEESIYSLATEYGKLAYSIFADIESKKKLELTDIRVKKLIMLGLVKSYNLPIDVWNSIGKVSAQDIDPLLSACLGIDPELLEKKSDGCEE